MSIIKENEKISEKESILENYIFLASVSENSINSGKGVL